MSVNEHLAVLRNPFSLATPTAKVPDGKVNLSTAERQQTSFQKQFVARESVIMLCPSFSVPYVITNNTTVAPAAQVYVQEAVQYGDAGHVLTYATPGARHTFTKSVTAPDKWRLVSAGLRMSLTNNSDTNDGWFEAIRVNTSYSPQDFRVTNPQAPNVNFNVYQDILTMERGILNYDQSWANDPSYMTGKLRDIHKWMFYLQASEERDFKSLPSTWEDNIGAEHDDVFTCSNASVTPGFMIDSGFDCCAIRLHTSSTVALPTSMLIHSVHNFEGVYDASSTLCKFQSSTPNAPELVLKSDRYMRRDIKPAVLRVATEPVTGAGRVRR
jgi:hypothetical protein